MSKLLIQILNDLVRNNPEKCKEIVGEMGLIFYRMVPNSSGTDIKVWEIIPFFWQFPNQRRSCLPGASEGKTWALLSDILYDSNKCVCAVKCWNYQSLPPDEVEKPIEEVDDSVIASVIHLLLAKFFPLSNSIDTDLLLKGNQSHNIMENSTINSFNWFGADKIARKILRKYRSNS